MVDVIDGDFEGLGLVVGARHERPGEDRVFVWFADARMVRGWPMASAGPLVPRRWTVRRTMPVWVPWHWVRAVEDTTERAGGALYCAGCGRATDAEPGAGCRTAEVHPAQPGLLDYRVSPLFGTGNVRVRRQGWQRGVWGVHPTMGREAGEADEACQITHLPTGWRAGATAPAADLRARIDRLEVELTRWCVHYTPRMVRTDDDLTRLRGVEGWERITEVLR
ncbi:MAG: hypothetical protein H6705_16825 [Myxococcales bacterium]|nr:hypothetical protein [Myxococcales bacterium]